MMLPGLEQCSVFKGCIVRGLTILLIFLSSATLLASDVPLFGPMRGGDRNPLLDRFYMPRPEMAQLTAKGQWRLDLNMAYSNIFEVAESEQWVQDTDFEQFVLRMGIRRGFGERWEAGLSVPVYGRWEGFLDSAIQSYHKFFGFPNDRRDEFENDRYRNFFGPFLGEPLLNETETGFSAGEPELFLRYGLKSWDGGAMALGGTLKLPAEGESGSGETDLALEFNLSHDAGRYRFHGTLAMISLGTPNGWESVLTEESYFASAAFEIPWRKWALLVQVDAFDGYLESTGLKTLEPLGVDLTLGLAGRAGSWDWQVGFAEDLTGDGPAIDFTLDLHLMRRF